MILVYLTQPGQASVRAPQRIAQGTDSESIVLISPFPARCPVLIGWVMPDGTPLTATEAPEGANGSYYPMTNVIDPEALGVASGVSVWLYKPDKSYTAQAGTALACFMVQQQKAGATEGAYAYENLTTNPVEVEITETILPAVPSNPSSSVWQDVLEAINYYNTYLQDIDDNGVSTVYDVSSMPATDQEKLAHRLRNVFIDSTVTEDSDNLVTSGAVHTAISDAVEDAEDYVDTEVAKKTAVTVGGVLQSSVSFTSDPQTQINNLANAITEGDASTLSEAKTYADQKAAAKTAVNVGGVLKDHVDFTSDPQQQITALGADISESASTTLASAKAYTDTEVAKKTAVTINNVLAESVDFDSDPQDQLDQLDRDITSGDASTLQAAKDYTNAAVSVVKQFNVEVVQTLPTQNISTNTIYLVPSTSQSLGDVYGEYIYVNNHWELLGTKDVDLSTYATKSEVQAAITTAEGYTNQQVSTKSAVMISGSLAPTVSFSSDPQQQITSLGNDVSGLTTAVNGKTSVSVDGATTANLSFDSDPQTQINDLSAALSTAMDDVGDALDEKQDALSPQTAYTQKGSATKVPVITTNELGQVTSVTEENISLSNPNLLINGDFSLNTNGNQSYTFGSTGGYTLNRVYVQSGTVTKITNGINFTSEYQTAGFKRLEFPIATKLRKDEKYTFSLKAEVNSVSGTVQMRFIQQLNGGIIVSGSSTTISSTSKVYSNTITCPADYTSAFVEIIVGNTETSYINVDIEWVKVEKGATATEFSPDISPITLDGIGGFNRVYKNIAELATNNLIPDYGSSPTTYNDISTTAGQAAVTMLDLLGVMENGSMLLSDISGYTSLYPVAQIFSFGVLELVKLTNNRASAKYTALNSAPTSYGSQTRMWFGEFQTSLNDPYKWSGWKEVLSPGHNVPASDDANDIGSSSLRWKNLYLSGVLSDGSNSISISEIASAVTPPPVIASTVATSSFSNYYENVKCFKFSIPTNGFYMVWIPSIANCWTVGGVQVNQITTGGFVIPVYYDGNISNGTYLERQLVLTQPGLDTTNQTLFGSQTYIEIIKVTDGFECYLSWYGLTGSDYGNILGVYSASTAATANPSARLVG